MAINQQVESNSPLEIPASEYYFTKLRPYLKEVYKVCVTDEELCRTITKAMNEADSACVRESYDDMAAAFDVLYTGITDKNYFNGVMKKATEEEKTLVRGIAEKIVDIRTIVKYEKKKEPNQVIKRERLGYNNSSPNGENLDFGSHNMSELNKCEPKQRIPNV